MGMEVNEGKTKVMVFRKGEHLGKHEKWYYAGKSMKVPTVIHIWVLLLQQSYVTKKELLAFVAKGKKAVFHLCKALKRLKDMT